jgi:hypothetical protein
MQEDGLEILKGALFGDSSVTTKSAAAYGLRKMHGRMKKMVLEVFRQGREHQQRSIRDVCTKALILLGEITPEKHPVRKAAKNLRIREIPTKAKPRRRISIGTPAGPAPRRVQSRTQRPMNKNPFFK